MASRIGKTPFRTLSAQAVAVSRLKNVDSASSLKVTKLPNGLSVASFDDGSQMSSVTLSVKAGSRYEPYENLGASHVFRAAVGLRSKNFTGFGITRNIQQAGSNLTTTGSRDFITFETNFLRDNVTNVLVRAFDAICNPEFKKWQLPDANGYVDLHLAEMEPHVKAMEMLHKAAYRDGLGNSLFCPDHKVGKVRPSHLHAFHQSLFTTERAVIVGAGIDHESLVYFANDLNFKEGSGPGVPPTKFYAGDERAHATGTVAYVALATEAGNTVADKKEELTFQLLRTILGDGQKVKYGVPSGKLAKALPSDGSQAVSGLYLGYEGASLIGFLLASEAATVGENLAKVVAAVRNLDVTEADFKAAKNVMRLELHERLYDNMDRCDVMVRNALLTKDFISMESLISMLNTVTLADVQAAAKKLSNAKLSLGGCGNLGNVPYVDTL